MKHPAIEQEKVTFTNPFVKWPLFVEHTLGRRQVQILAILLVALLIAIAFDRILPVYLRWMLLGSLLCAAVFNRLGRFRVASMIIVFSIWVTPYLGFASSPFELDYRLLSSFMWHTLPIFLSSVLFERRALTMLIVVNFLMMLLIPLVFTGVTYGHIQVSLEFVGVISVFFWIVTYQRDMLQIERRQQLARSEEKFYKAFENTSVGVTIRSLMDGQYLDVNDAFANMLGYDKETFMGKSPNDFDFWINQQAEHQRAKAIYDQQRRLPETEIYFRHRDGEIRTGLLTLEMVDIGGEPCTLGTLQDITARIQIEQALVQSQQRFQILANNLPGAVYLCQNDEQYTPIYLNEGIEKVTGYDKDLFLTHEITFGELYHPDDVSFITNQVDRSVAAQQQFHLFYRMKHKDGRWRWIEEVGRGIYEGEAFYLEGFMQDVTDRREAEMSLARQAAEMTALYDLSLLLNQELELDKLAQVVVERAAALLNTEMSSLVLKDLQSGELVLVATYNMPEGIEPLSAHSKVGTTYHVVSTRELLHIEDYSQWPHRIQKPPWDTLGRILSAPLVYGTEVIGVISAFDHEPGRFNQEQQQLFTLFATYVAVAVQNAHFFRNEQRQREVAEALREAGRAVNSTLALSDVLDFILTEARKVTAHDVAHIMLVENDQYLKMISAESPYENHDEYPLLNELLPLSQLPLSAQVLTEQRPLLLEDTRLETRFQGSYRSSERVGSLVILPLISQNKSIGVLTMIGHEPYALSADDLEAGMQFSPYLVNAIVNARLLEQTQQYNTELKKRVAERTDELVIAKNEAERANMAKSAFLANMSHELRTPLTAILGFTRIMLQHNALMEDEQEYLRIIHYSGKHLLTLINDVLDMSKIEAGKVALESQAFDLNQLLVLIEGMFRLRAADKGLELQTVYNGPFPCYVLGDKRKLSQILINLLNNAVKFTEAGYVRLNVEAQYTAAESLQATFVVEDSGVGIDSESIKLLFQPFTQLAQNQFQEGSGLGLAISQEYVHLMGGEIQVTSTVDVGSTFAFTLSLALSDAAEIPPDDFASTIVGLQSDQPVYRILIVERIKENGLLLRALLAPVGFETKVVSTPADLEETYRTWRPHLIFLNNKILVEHGLYNDEFGLFSIEPKPIILATHSSNFDQEQRQRVANHVDGFVQRPFREQEIFEKLSHYLNVRYITTDLPDSQPSSTSPTQTGTDIDLTGVSNVWLAEMHTAAVMSDQQQMKTLINQIQPTHPQIAAYMTHLVTTFATRRLIEITSAFSKEI